MLSATLDAEQSCSCGKSFDTAESAGEARPCSTPDVIVIRSEGEVLLLRSGAFNRLVTALSRREDGFRRKPEL